jgi:hypothetical protein
MYQHALHNEATGEIPAITNYFYALSGAKYTPQAHKEVTLLNRPNNRQEKLSQRFCILPGSRSKSMAGKRIQRNK